VLDGERASKRPRLGFIGIGLMGEAMTRRLLDQGWQVSVWNLEPERLDTVVPFGAIPCSSPALVAEASDTVLVCVLHTATVENCVFGDRPRLVHHRSAPAFLAARTRQISGLGHPGPLSTPQANGPVIRDAISIFGSDRCMFASNYPVDSLVGSFDEILACFLAVIADRSPAEQRMLVHDNAKRIYRLDGVRS
jgi:hypothetical protein